MKEMAGNKICPKCGKENLIKELLDSRYYEECHCKNLIDNSNKIKGESVSVVVFDEAAYLAPANYCSGIVGIPDFYEKWIECEGFISSIRHSASCNNSFFNEISLDIILDSKIPRLSTGKYRIIFEKID